MADSVVFCLECGAELRRREAARSPGETWRCFQWVDLQGNVARNCPGCGAITSNLTTGPLNLDGRRERINRRLACLQWTVAGRTIGAVEALLSLVDARPNDRGGVA